jgi:hypothetical protein
MNSFLIASSNGDTGNSINKNNWIPACAGMTKKLMTEN